MPKRVFIIHGWYGNPQECWFPWLKRELESRGFVVEVPAMPNTNEPKIFDWIKHLRKTVGIVDENTYFVGHSIGCQAIMRLLEVLEGEERAGGAVFVAGWFTLMGLEEGEQAIAKPWLEEEIDTDEVRAHIGKVIAIFCEDDPFVPAENIELFEQNLGAKTFVESEKGHFSGEDNVHELPSALNAVIEIMQEKL